MYDTFRISWRFLFLMKRLISNLKVITMKNPIISDVPRNNGVYSHLNYRTQKDPLVTIANAPVRAYSNPPAVKGITPN